MRRSYGQLEADHEQQEHHAELSQRPYAGHIGDHDEVEPACFISEPYQPEGPHRQTNQQKAQHRAHPDPFEQRDNQTGCDQEHDRIM